MFQRILSRCEIPEKRLMADYNGLIKKYAIKIL